MCLFRGGAPAPMATPAPIVGRNPDIVKESQLPAKKDLLDPDEITGVEYGTSAKKSDPVGSAKRIGTDALKINVNTGGSPGGSTGGLNV